MSKIVYLPLDERPCNAKYPVLLAEIGGLVLTSPPAALLGSKKKPAENAGLAQWLLAETETAEWLIVSLDMLIYGGIVPSRLHSLTPGECAERMALLTACKARNPRLRIYAFNLIMRAPAYNNNDEEPDYYGVFGAILQRLGWLTDKAERELLTREEGEEFKRLASEIPAEVVTDFTGRRAINAGVNHLAIDYVREGVIDHLVIPLDDNAKYGYTAMEQRQLLFKVEAERLMDRVRIYPGADEIGCTLLARVFCELAGYAPEAYVRYSSTQGPYVIPPYEDRSLNESIKAHLNAAGVFITDSAAEADFVLMVNAPPVGQSDAAETSLLYRERHRAYFSEVNLAEFVRAIQVYARKGKFVALADVATANGADEPLMQLLAQTGALSDLSAYAAWNTSGNALGTVIAHAVIASGSCRRTIYPSATGSIEQQPRQPMERDQQEGSGQGRQETAADHSRRFLLYRLLEDWGYQSNVRAAVNLEELDCDNTINSPAPADRLEAVHTFIAQELNVFHQRYLAGALPCPVQIGHVALPWRRTFEVDFDLLPPD